jgi:hypothetical protein
LKNLFALRGASNMGKSQTIRTVVELLSANHPEATIEHDHTTKTDTRIVLTINGWKIGIESRLINDSLRLFIDAGCDVIVCATRTSGATVNAVNALQRFDIRWFEQPKKSQPYEQILRSLAMARQIVAELEALIQPALVRTMAATA